jgi:heme/copper-type cytochrome/quinol oxidase subunit 4
MFDKSIFNKTYDINISEHIGQDYIHIVESVFKMLTIQIIVQFMYFLKSPYENHFFSAAFFELILYLVVGLCVYWLIFKRLIKIT